MALSRMLYPRYIYPSPARQLDNPAYISAIRSGVHTGDCLMVNGEYCYIDRVTEAGIYGFEVCLGCLKAKLSCSCKKGD